MPAVEIVQFLMSQHRILSLILSNKEVQNFDPMKGECKKAVRVMPPEL